jgi:hypothetical protein
VRFPVHLSPSLHRVFLCAFATTEPPYFVPHPKELTHQLCTNWLNCWAQNRQSSHCPEPAQVEQNVLSTHNTLHIIWTTGTCSRPHLYTPVSGQMVLSRFYTPEYLKNTLKCLCMLWSMYCTCCSLGPPTLMLDQYSEHLFPWSRITYTPVSLVSGQMVLSMLYKPEYFKYTPECLCMLWSMYCACCSS